jgi:hypothetical protein
MKHWGAIRLLWLVTMNDNEVPTTMEEKKTKINKMQTHSMNLQSWKKTTKQKDQSLLKCPIFICIVVFKYFQMLENSHISTIFYVWRSLNIQTIWRDINVPTLSSNIWKLLVFYEKKSYFMGILKIWNLFINHMTTTLKGLISNIKIQVALVYLLMNTFKIGFIPFHNKIRHFPMWIIFNSFKRIQIYKFAWSLWMDRPKKWWKNAFNEYWWKYTNCFSIKNL